MKTFTSISKFPAGTSGHAKDMREIRIIEADPKREGMYIQRRIQVGGGKVRIHCDYYGKKNQAKIIENAQKMFEVC